MRKIIYDFFSNEVDSNGDYYNIGTFEEFEKDMQNPDARKEFYDFFSNEVDENGDYYNLGTFAEFEQDIARSTAKEIGKASAQATGQAIKEQPKVAHPVTAVQASDRGPFYTTKAFGDWLNGQPNPQMVEQTKAINQAQASGQVTETPTAPSAPKAEDITTTKATATTAEAPKVESTANPVSALQKKDGTPYKAEELQATADKQQAELTAQEGEQPTVQSSAEIEAEIDEKIANQGYLSTASVEADKARLAEAKAREAEGDQKAEDGDKSWEEYKAKLKDLYGGMNIPEASQVGNFIGISLPGGDPMNRYAPQYIEYAEQKVLQKLHEIAIEQNGGQPLSDAQMIAITNQAKSMSEKDVQKVLGAEGLEALRKAKEQMESFEKRDQRNAHAINNLLTDHGIANYLKRFYDGKGLAEVATNAVVGSGVELGQMNADDAKKYIGARMAKVDYLLGDDAMQYYLRNINNNNEQAKQKKAQAILSTAVTINDLLYGGIGLPEKAKTYARNALKTAVKNGQIGTTDGNAVVNDVLNRLQNYPQLFGQLSEDAKKVVLNRLNYVLPTAKITSLEDAMWGDTTIYNALVGEITKYFQQLGAVEDFDSKRSEAEEKYKEMIEDAGSTFQGNPYAPGWVNVKNWAEHTVDQIPDAREWSVAIDMNDDTADILNNSAKSGFGGFFQGLADGTFDLSTWDFGFSDTQKNLAIKNVLTKLDNDEPLTEGETALADAIVSNLAAQALVSPSMAYKVGNGVAVSIPYLLEMTLPVLGVGKGVARKLYTFALKRETKGALKKIAKTISKVIGTGVESVERSVFYGVGKIGAKTIEKTTGEADIKRDENGELKVVGTKEGTKESLGKAITKSFLSQATTYFVERVGGDIFIPFTKGKDFVMNKIGGEFTPNEIWDGFVKRTGWQGTPSEFFEEILDQVAQATIEGEGFDKIATVDNLLTTAYTTLALGTMLKAPNAIGYKSESKRLEAQIEDLSAMGEIALGKEWEGIQSRIDNATFGEIQGVLSDIAKDKKLTPEQKRIAINYGLNVGVNKEIIDRHEKGQLYDKDNESIKAQEAIINAMEQGANITDVNEGYNTQIREDMTGESLARMVGVESISEAKDVIAQRYGTDSPMEIAIEVANDASLNDNQRKVILDYYTALATNQGKQTALEQKRDINKQTAEAVSAKTNKDMGKQVVTATRKADGAQVTIIAGNIVTNEDSSINKEKSDDAIVSVDANGNKEMISLGNISSIATQSKEDAELEERARLTQELEKAENVSNGRVSVGDVIDYGFYDGNTNAKSRKVVVTDVTTDADGNRMVTFVEQELNGAEPVTMTEKELEVGRDIAYKANNGYQIYNGPVGLPSMAKQTTQPETTQEQSTFKGDAPTETEQVVELTAPQQEYYPGKAIVYKDADGVYRMGEVASETDADGNVIIADGITGITQQLPTTQLDQWQQEANAPQAEESQAETPTNKEEQPQGEQSSSQEILDNSNKVAKDVPSVASVTEEIAQEEKPTTTEKQAETTPQVESTATPTAQVAIPTDEKGKKVYEQAPIEATIKDIYNDPELDEEEADAYVQAKIDGATKRIKAIDKKKPKMGEDRDAYVAQRDAWRAERNAEQAKLDYWQGVQAQRTKGKSYETDGVIDESNEPIMSAEESVDGEGGSNVLQGEQLDNNRGNERIARESQGSNVGGIDSNATSQEEIAEAKEAEQYYVDNDNTPGVVGSSYARAVLPSNVAVKLGKIAQALGVSIRIVPTMTDANAKIQGKKVVVAWNAEQIKMFGEDGLWMVVGHELTHRIKALSKEAYEDFASVIESIFPKQFKQRMINTRLAYSRKGMKISDAGLREEVVSDLAGILMTDDKMMAKFLDGLQPKSTKQQILDILKDMLDAIKNIFKGETAMNIAKAERVLLDAMKKANKVVAQDETTEADNATEKLSIIGESGASALDKAEEATHRMENLEVAREMEENGKDAKAIRMATGWERGADGKWRYEIDDVKLDKSALRKLRIDTTYSLSEILTPETYNTIVSAYPLFKDVKVLIKPLDSFGGDWDNRRKLIRVNSRYLNNSRLKSTISHEIQHAIQDSEGFEQGAHPMDFMNIFLSPLYIQQMSIIRSNADDLVKKGKYKYLRNAIRSVVNMYLDRGWIDSSVIEQYGMNDSINNYVDEIASYSAEELMQEAYNTHTANDKYMRVAGEVEARNVQSRIGMTPDQRRATLLAETEDVAREDQIFLMDNSGVSAMGSTVVKRKADIAVKLHGKNISPTQLKVVDAFTTDVNNIAIDVVDANGKQRNITLKQGQDNRAGVKHSVLKHYETASNSYSAEDILLIPQIIEQGERKQDGKKVSYKLGLNGVTYSVTTEINNRGAEVFTNFYTNRSGNARSSNTQLSAQADSTTTSADKGSDNIGDVQGLEDYSAEEIKEIAREYIEEVIAENGFDADVVDLAIYGSRRRGDARDDSDLDIVVEYSGNVSEDGLFNALNDAETQLEINGVKVDINPITKGKSGSLSEFMKRAEEYDSDTKYSLRSNSQEVADIVAKAKADGTYMKAPNGEPTNLTEEQWANVRTKAFKDWFGDWELAQKVINIISADKEHGFKNFADARNWAKENIVGLYHNSEIGEVNISRKSIDKYLSGKAVGKSQSIDAHLSTIRVLPQLIENSIVGDIHEDRDSDSNLKDIVRLYGAIDIEGDVNRVKITVKRYADENTYNKAYSYEVMEIEPLEGTLETTHTKSADFVPTSKSSITGANLLKGVENSKGEPILNFSKIVDENGEPMVVYHGTESDFNVFDRTKGRASMDIQGMFFSPWELDAQGYGRNVRAFYLNIRKPSSGGQSYKALNRYQGQMYAGVKARDYLIGLGYDGVDNYGEEFIAFEPNQIKSATDNVGTYSSEDNDIRYSLRGTTPFYSNAEYAVENIKQEKATPEQWLAMIQKNGGLKAGEDKWLGLSDWLNEKGKRKDERGKSVTLTKEEVLEFIKANQIVVEDVQYDDYSNGVPSGFGYELRQEMREYAQDIANYSRQEYEELGYDAEDILEETRRSVEENLNSKYGVDAVTFFALDDNFEIVDTRSDLEFNDFADVVWQNNQGRVSDKIRPSNSTRLNYTTKGLDNKREIALVVPTINPYKQSDEIHFGDAGGGRAVAWIRFGETTDENGNRVLVIDEIQSKRHQDGREKGYSTKQRREEAKKKLDSLVGVNGRLLEIRKRMKEIDSQIPNNLLLSEKEQYRKTLPEYEEYEQLRKEGISLMEDNNIRTLERIAKGEDNTIPDAPFDKNWQELAMKRMLRYAAENGYDKVAWTTGAQQAERYNLSSAVEKISVKENSIEEFSDGKPIYKNVTIHTTSSGNIRTDVDAEGVIHGGEYKGKGLADVVGKELADKILSSKDDITLQGDNLRLGGEGMKGFYDKMLPSFMNKYGKKWGVKVGEVTMPELQEGYQTMHSIDVTDAMKESVMEGQPLFRDGSGAFSDADLSYANDPFAKALGKSQRSKAKQAKFAERERKYMRNRVAELVEKLGIGERVKLIEGGKFDNERKARAKGWYDAKRGKIVINLANHTSVADIERTLLHEAVSHHGLRELFGKQFNTFLDNVFRSANYNIRTQIVGLATRNGWDFRTATEEYLAQLAEDTNFDALENNWSFWSKIKQLFMDMLESIGWNYQGPTLTDNELRYLLWRSYENMVNPGRHRSILGMAEDATKREKFGIGTYRTDENVESQVADGEGVKYSLRDNADNKRDIGEKMVKNVILNDIEGKPLPNDRKSAFEYIPEGGIVYKNDAEEVNIKVSRKSVKHTALHKKDDTYAIFGGIGEVIKEAIKIGEMPVAQDEIGKTNSVGVYYVPVNINGTQYSARLLVKELINNDIVLDDLSLYHVGLHKEKGSQYKPLNASNEVGGVTAKPISKYKVKDLIYNSQEQDKKILGITGDTKFSLRVGESDGTREEYDKRVKTTSKKFEKSAMTFYNFMEAFVDEMRSLDILQRIVEKKYGIKLPSFENALDAENRSSSMALKEFEAFMDGEYDAMMQFVDRWIKRGETTQSINYYMIAKSGLERNREFTVRDAINELLNHEDESKRITKAQAEQMRKNYADERNALLAELKSGNIDYVTFNKLADKLARKHAFGHKIEDYSGLTGITGDENNFRQIAEDMVLEFEAKHKDAVVDFWSAVKDVTKAPLRKSYGSGLLSKSMYDKLTTMFEWYIPMRGFEEETAEDVYSYIGADTGVFNPTVALAKGHTEVSDDPLAIMGNMMQSAILQGNRNAVKQRLLFMARNHPVDVLTESRVWLVLHPDGTWVSSYPELSNDMSADQVAQAIAEHEAKMEKLAKDKKAKISNVNLDVDFKIEKASNKSAHAIDVMLNGNHYVIYVNGNPRVAQAVNGQLKDKGTNWLYKVWQSYARWYTASKTSLDVNFMFPNVGRDIQHSTLMTIMDKGFIQGLKFFFNGFATIIPVIKGASGVQIKGPKMRKYWEEFVKYGGETGYAHLESVDDFKRKNETRLKRMKGVKKATTIAKGTFKYIGSAFDYANRIAESSTRFNAYVSSRKSGADIYDAIRYAKDITVNFNRKGSSMTPGIFGAAANAYRIWMPFANPIIQGIYQFLKVGRRNKGRFFTICGVQMALGFVIPMVNEILFEAIGGDDEDKYINQPDHVRRTNMIFYIGGKYIKIPLPPMFRELYGLGDIAWSYMKGLYNTEEATWETVDQIRSMFSLQGQSSMEGKEFSLMRFILPGHLAWIADIEENTTFTGQPLYKEGDFIDEQTPEYQKVYNGTWRYLVEWSRELNHFLGGTDDKAAEMPLGMPSRWMNPAVWQHVISEFGGGPYKFVMDIADLASPESNDEGEPAEFTWSKVPVAKRFVAEVGDRAETRLLNKQYYDYIDSFDDIEYEEKVYTKKAKMGSMEYAEKLNELILSPEYREYKVKNGYEKAVKDLNKYLNDPGLDKSDRKQVEDAIERFKREVLTEAPKAKNFPADGASEKVKEKLDSIKDVVEDVIGDGNEQTKERNRVIRDAKSNLEPLDMEAWKEEQKDKVK